MGIIFKGKVILIRPPLFLRQFRPPIGCCRQILHTIRYGVPIGSLQ
jgi:hypothetical protein